MARYIIRKVKFPQRVTGRWQITDRQTGKRWRCGTWKFALIIVEDLYADGESSVTVWRYRGT